MLRMLRLMLTPLSSTAITTPAVLVSSVGVCWIWLPRESALLLGPGIPLLPPC